MNLALFIADPDVRVNQQIAIGLLRELQQHGPWCLHIHNNTRVSLMPHSLQTTLREIRPQAVVSHATIGAQSVDVIQALSIPWVGVAVDCLPQVPIPVVVPDQEAIGIMAADHFVGQRFRHTAMVGFKSTHDLPRFKVFRDRITRAGRTLDEFLLPKPRRRMDHPASIGGKPGRLMDWLQRLPEACGLFAYSDQPGAHVIRIATQHGIRVPDDVSVLGVDDDVLFCHSVYPNLASIHVPYAHMGTEAARLILDWQPERRVLKIRPASVIERESVRAPALEDPLVDRALEHLRTHVAQGVRVRDLQKLTGLTPQMLVYRFRESIHSTPIEEILRHRIRFARQLLRETATPVSAVAHQCGFNSANQFYVTFRKLVGMSPRDYRQQFPR